MCSETPKAKCPVKTFPLPGFPQDIIDEILNRLGDDSDLRSLRACALASRSWSQPSRLNLFRTVTFTSRSADKWFRVFPVPEESPARYVRDLQVQIGWGDPVPGGFFEYVPRFTDVKGISLLGHMAPPSSLGPSSWKLPQSITSLTINSSVFTLVQIRDVMAQLPNLDNLTLMSSFVEVDRRELRGIGTVVKGRFGGKLKLCGEYVGKEVANMLLEIPSGLHFTEAIIHCTPECLPSAVRLAEACCKTLVKLSYPVAFSRESPPSLNPTKG